MNKDENNVAINNDMKLHAPTEIISATLFYCATYSALHIALGAFIPGDIGVAFSQFNVIAFIMIFAGTYKPQYYWDSNKVIAFAIAVFSAYVMVVLQEDIVKPREYMNPDETIVGVYAAAVMYGIAELTAYVTRILVWKKFTIFRSDIGYLIKKAP